jgi:exodeoxyribonuclease III
LKIATWNINSINLRLPRLVDWLAAHAPDVLCLQETKLEDQRFPHLELAAAGYRAHCFGQRTYNGVAILVREGLPHATDVVMGLDPYPDEQKRAIAATVDGVRIVCFYVPNGQRPGSDKYGYKLEWCAAATDFLRREVATHPALVVVGDFNIAPDDRDVHDPERWRDAIMCSEPERDVYRAWIALGLVDAFRLFPQPEGTFTWWDYRQLAFPKNHGLRIDHVLLSPSLAERCTRCMVDRNSRKGAKPSDHAPVIAEIATATVHG